MGFVAFQRNTETDTVTHVACRSSVKRFAVIMLRFE